MSITQQTRREQIELSAQWFGGLFGGLFSALGGGLRSLGQQRAGGAAMGVSPMRSGEMSELLARAVCENSNRAMDWLYYASQLSSRAERRYCAHCAMLIDAGSGTICAELLGPRRC